MQISLVVPNRNNLRYFKWMYDSVRKNQGDHEVWICSADDGCSDGTAKHYYELAKRDPYFKFITNPSPTRLGHTVLYDRIVNELVETELAMIFHCDMYLCPGALDAIERLMYNTHGGRMIRPEEYYNRIVSLTRIEPPLHPGGLEKIVAGFGTEPENFDEIGFLYQIGIFNQLNHWEYTCRYYPDNPMKFEVPLTGTTNGVFAPWAFWVDEFKEIGGHDWLYRPQSKEDDDIWNRFILNGTELIQARDGFVYHLTCRGNRRNVLEGATDIQSDNPEWVQHNVKSTRNFIRKWGYFIKHDKWHYPIISHKYDVAVKITNCTYNLLANLEPWFSQIVSDLPIEQIHHYIQHEQPNTTFNLFDRIRSDLGKHDVFVTIDGLTFTGEDFVNVQILSDILTESGEIGSFQLGNLFIEINALTHYENELIICKNEPIQLYYE